MLLSDLHHSLGSQYSRARYQTQPKHSPKLSSARPVHLSRGYSRCQRWHVPGLPEAATAIPNLDAVADAAIPTVANASDRLETPASPVAVSTRPQVAMAANRPP